MKSEIGLALLPLLAGTAEAQTAKERRLDGSPYGLAKARCAWYRGGSIFLMTIIW
jgi:hypothetical protein